MGQRIERVSDLREFSQKLTGYTGTALIFTKSFIIDFDRFKNKVARLEEENRKLREKNKSLELDARFERDLKEELRKEMPKIWEIW